MHPEVQLNHYRLLKTRFPAAVKSFFSFFVQRPLVSVLSVKNYLSCEISLVFT